MSIFEVKGMCVNGGDDTSTHIKTIEEAREVVRNTLLSEDKCYFYNSKTQVLYMKDKQKMRNYACQPADHEGYTMWFIGNTI